MMVVRSFLALLALSGLAACTVLKAPQAAPGQRVALVIGNGAYTGLPALANPSNDADDICKALKALAFATTCLKNLRDRAAFEAAVTDYLERLSSGGVGVVYYAGHGLQVAGRNQLVATQADASAGALINARALYPVDELFERLRRKSPRYQLVVLDACRTELPGRASGVRSIQEAPPDTMVLYAAGSGAAAYDGDGRNGPLTKHVLQHLGTRGIEQAEFLRRVREGVVNETTRNYSARQTPYSYGSFNGSFCFAGCPGAPPPNPGY